MLTGIMLKKKAAFENYVVILISSLNQVCQDLLTIMIPPEYSSFAIPHGVSFSSERPTRPVENSWAIDGAETCADFLGSLDGFFSGAFRISKGQGVSFSAQPLILSAISETESTALAVDALESCLMFWLVSGRD